VASVTEAWARIEGWMGRHTPRCAAVLAPPAAASAIAAAEVELGLTFPVELVESLRRRDGLTTRARVLPKAPLLSVADIVGQYQERMDIAEDVDGFSPHGPDAQPWWHRLWLPFAASDGGLQVIDLRPGIGFARVGWAPHDNPGDFSDAWPSLGDYLMDVADALDTSGAVGAWHPYLTVRDELWWGLDAATELNGEPLRPAPPR
jgi:cell wall assembly regulator SMI1